MSKKQIKAVIFDIGGVLELGYSSKRKIKGHVNLGVHNYIARNLGISIDQWFDSIDTIYAASITGEISESKVLDIISKNTKTLKQKLKKIIIQSYKKNFKQNKDLYKFAFKIKKQGYKIAILSDQWYFSKQVLIPNKLTKKFNVVVVSCDVGFRKPKPEIYKIILRKLKLPAKSCIFIDNQTWNLAPAKKIGIKTILYKNNKQLFRQLKKLGVKIK